MPAQSTSIPSGEQLYRPLDTFEPITLPQLHRLRDVGRAAVGIVAALLNENGHILTLEHNGSAKVIDGAIGPLAETAQLRSTESGLTIPETCAQTLTRGLWEEMQVMSDVEVLVAAEVPGFTFDWPSGKNTDRFSHAICPVMRVVDPEKLLAEFTPSKEVRAASFRSPEEILGTPNVRGGTHDWTVALLSTVAYEQRDSLVATPHTLQSGPAMDQTGIDITFADLEL